MTAIISILGIITLTEFIVYIAKYTKQESVKTLVKTIVIGALISIAEVCLIIKTLYSNNGELIHSIISNSEFSSYIIISTVIVLGAMCLMFIVLKTICNHNDITIKIEPVVSAMVWTVLMMILLVAITLIPNYEKYNLGEREINKVSNVNTDTMPTENVEQESKLTETIDYNTETIEVDEYSMIGAGETFTSADVVNESFEESVIEYISEDMDAQIIENKELIECAIVRICREYNYTTVTLNEISDYEDNGKIVTCYDLQLDNDNWILYNTDDNVSFILNDN